MVRTFQITKALAAMPVIDNMMLAAPEQPGESFVNLFIRRGAVKSREREVRDEAMELLEVFNLTKLADAYAGTLSGGQRKLLELARALMAKPKLLLLDEPMAGINPTLGKRLLDHMQRLRKEEGVTFLFIEHDMEVVMNHSDEVVVMAEGKVIASGEPEEVRKDEKVIDAYLGGAAHDSAKGTEVVNGEVEGQRPDPPDRGPGRGLRPRGGHPHRRRRDGERGRDRHRRRPQRRRQVHADQVDLRAAAPAQGDR